MLSRLRHLGLQVLAALAAMYFVAPAGQPLAWAILQGLCAAALAIFMRLPGWQRLLHGLFVPALALMHQAALPPWVYLLGLALTFALGRNAVLERVPLYRSSAQAAERLAERLPGRAALLEAGCGDGRLAVWLCRLRPDVRVRALESAWGSWLLARARWWLARRPRRLEFACRSFWRESWGEYDAVYVFLSPEPMAKVWRKFVAEGRPGSLLVSNTFAVPDVEPDERIPLGGALQTELLIWRHPHGAC